MRKTGYLLWQTLQSMIYYKKRYVLYFMSFYVGLLLPALCIANYNYIRSIFHYYVFDEMEQSVSLDWQSYSFAAADLDISGEYTISAQCQEVFLGWDSTPMSVKGIEWNYYYDLSQTEGRMFTEGEMGRGEYVCIIDRKNARAYDCRLNDTITIKGVDFTVIGFSTDPLFTNQIVIPLAAMEKLYGNHDTCVQFTGIYILDKNQDKEQFLLEVKNAVCEKDEEAKILFLDTGDQMYQEVLKSVEKWKFLRGMAAFMTAVFFILNELVVITGKMQKDRKTIAVKMALGASRYTVAFSCLLEISIITVIADAMIFLSVCPIARACALDEIILFDSFVTVVFFLGSIGAAVVITLVLLWNLRKDTVSSLMRSEDV